MIFKITRINDRKNNVSKWIKLHDIGNLSFFCSWKMCPSMNYNYRILRRNNTVIEIFIICLLYLMLFNAYLMLNGHLIFVWFHVYINTFISLFRKFKFESDSLVFMRAFILINQIQYANFCEIAVKMETQQKM